MTEQVKFRCRTCGQERNLSELMEDRKHSSPWPTYYCSTCAGNKPKKQITEGGTLS